MVEILLKLRKVQSGIWRSTYDPSDTTSKQEPTK